MTDRAGRPASPPSPRVRAGSPRGPVPEAPAESASRQVPVRWRLSAHARRLVTLAMAGLAIAVVTHRPEYAGVAAPAVLLLVNWRGGRPAEVTIRVRQADSGYVEGLESAFHIDIGSHQRYDAEVRIVPGDGITAGPAVLVPALTPAAPGEAGGALPPPGRHLDLPFTVQRWGRRQAGMLAITFRDRYRLNEGIVSVGLPWIDSKPLPAPLSSTIVLSQLPSRLGEHSARATGEGVEFAGVREFVPGDRQRRINWPATTRHGKVYLSTFASERTQNVVVVADATASVGEPGATSLDLVLRGAAGAITRYLARRDRVGLVIYATRLSWIPPGQGQRQLRRLTDLLIASRGGWDRSEGLRKLPRAALPPGALILVFSPLLDPGLVETLRDVRERGFTVVVVDVLNSEPAEDGSDIAALVGRVWRLEQQAIRYSMTQIGVPVVHWDGKTSLDDPLAPFSRQAMVVRR